MLETQSKGGEYFFSIVLHDIFSHKDLFIKTNNCVLQQNVHGLAGKCISRNGELADVKWLFMKKVMQWFL